ncbi:sce7725 family protein [Ralstonia pseudosolanacearum]|uniref:sce7725 family protein n=1 Tax=Ralstonia pseudosolanacearum TaxID=1310165 RepID=UPI001FFB58EB|nr:sce7725 family protein [Ralstonia pseudosolanacearum]MDC6285464.1 sce7725 family protein [Ralstonia pseudosolanacearum]
MYYPYFRGKQFELVTIRETADLLAQSNFVPIIEPVKETLSGLERTLKVICDAKGTAIVIVNPDYGDHAEGGGDISKLLNNGFSSATNIAAGILLKKGMSVDDAMQYHEQHNKHHPVFIHAGFAEPKALAEKFGDGLKTTPQVFVEKHCGGKLYWRHFKGCRRILLRDGFEKCKNADYREVDRFSELHATFAEEGMDGFGDFSIVGDTYSEGGGPAYAVAIHLTYIDPDQDDEMFIYHFISTTNNTPTDPAGKFGQALAKLIGKLDSGKSKLFEGEAIAEFRDLHAKQHFPGLGYVKKLSMKHHLETLANFLT